MEVAVQFLVADAIEANIENLKRIISKIYPKSPIYVATDGEYVCNFISKQKIPLVLICDLNIPGINGLQVVKKLRSESKYNDFYLILMTSNSDHELNLKTLQGGADDFLNKPFIVDELVSKLRHGASIIQQNLKIQELRKAISSLNDELKLESENTFELIIRFQQARIPETVLLLKNVASASLWIAEELGETLEEDGLKNIEKATRVAYIGKLFLPDNMIKTSVMVNGVPRNETMTQVPVYSKDILSKIRNFDKITDIVFHLYENFDGSGIPDKIQGWQIPVGSRIIRVVLEFFELNQLKGVSPPKAIEQLWIEAKRVYDHRIVALLDQYIGAVGIGGMTGRETPINIKDLTPGIVVTRDIITNSGIKLIPTGTSLDEEKIEKIKEITKGDPIIGKIYVR